MALRQRLSAVQNTCNSALGNVGRVRTNLDWQVTSQQGIDARLSAVQRRLQTQTELMRQYANFLNTVNDRFSATDRSLRDRAGELLYRIRQIAANLKSRINGRNAASLAAIAAVSALFDARPVERTGILGLVDRKRERFDGVREEVERRREEREAAERQRQRDDICDPPSLPLSHPNARLNGRVNCYGAISGRRHRGIDIDVPIGTPVLAPRNGTVIATGSHDPHGNDGKGHWMAIKHACGHVTVYMHLQNCVRDLRGTEVTRGQPIANVGNSGAVRSSPSGHLHLEVIRPPEGVTVTAQNLNHFRSNSNPQNPGYGHTIDPIDFFPDLRTVPGVSTHCPPR